MKYWTEKLSAFFLIANGPEEGKVYVCPASAHYVQYYEKDKEVLRKTLCMKPFVLPPVLVFVGTSYV